ncbi:hypothetical protein [Halostreptopolyspora alba]|uniref:Uncharacterized protein n=1 Tax=Halostreptopolyspora alba TaxID=2487137 RepID=A0A3N0E831_9ACTN|nr:hypothetical protein EFW17_14090 [Nocardiopsaceae bacterium YIM 96095]
MFCGDAESPGHAECVAQMGLFAIASTIPAMLALILLVAAFATPAIRADTRLRAQTLIYSLIGWAIAGFTYVLGGLPSV